MNRGNTLNDGGAIDLWTIDLASLSFSKIISSKVSRLVIVRNLKRNLYTAT